MFGMGRYRLLSQLGAGSMGAVYRAEDRLTGQDVALKHVVWVPDLPDAEVQSLRLALAHEFRLLAGLRHPHIISVLDYGFDHERQPFFTMELLSEAQTILEAGQLAPLERNVDYLIQALEALAYLHRRGILHHDLKPANVLLAHGRVRLLDFGLAVLANQQHDGESAGTLLYLAPEVLDGQPYTLAADLYSLGVIAYELLFGRHPFAAATISDFLDRVFTHAPDLQSLPVPAACAAFVGQLLAKNPSDRPASAQDAIALLRTAIGLPAAETQAIRESYLQAASFVGREQELAELTAALVAARTGHGSSWLVGGESGTGKSRLLNELRTLALVEGFMVIRGQAVHEGGLPYQLWREALRQLLVVTPQVDDLTASVLLPLVPDIAMLLGRPVAQAGSLDPTAAQIRLLTTIAVLFRQQHQPILVLLEDLQWADESLLVLAYLNRGITEQPLLLIGSYRDDERADLVQQLPEMRQLALPRLRPEHVAMLSEAMLGDVGRQPALLARLQKETEGNTFFLVEVVRALAEDGGQLGAIGRAELPERLMPQGIQSIIDRRLARIPVVAQQLLIRAAIAGRQLDLALLHELAPTIDLANWWLPVCAAAAVLEVQDDVWQFSHDKLREGLLAQIAGPDLPQHHYTVALALEQLYGGDERYAGQLAYHTGQAGWLEKEAEYSFRAGQYAQQQNSMFEAVRLLSRADTLISIDDRARRLDILRQRGLAHLLLGNWDATEADYQAAYALTQQPEDRAQALYDLGRLYRMRGNFDTALTWYRQAQVLWSELGDPIGLVQVLNEIGFALIRKSEYALAQIQLQDSLALARTSDFRDGVMEALNDLGVMALDQGDYPAARRLFEESLELNRELGNKPVIALILGNLGAAACNLGDPVAAQSFFEQSLALRRELGQKEGVASSLNNLGVLAFDRGEYTVAQGLYAEGLVLQREIGDAWGIASGLVNLGGLALRQGNYSAARRQYAEGLALAREIGDRLGVGYALAGLAELDLALGMGARAAQLAASTETLMTTIQATFDISERIRFNATIAAARAGLDTATFQAAWDAGTQLGLAEAVQYALSAPDSADETR
jgi:predicted ATPase/tRNA A-37 threonylcarbamoyl transferase component Bud32